MIFGMLPTRFIYMYLVEFRCLKFRSLQMMGRAMEDRVVLKPRSTRPECWIPISFGPVGHHMYHYRRVGLAFLDPSSLRAAV